jgi:hypothetical protein
MMDGLEGVDDFLKYSIFHHALQPFCQRQKATKDKFEQALARQRER